MLKPFQGASREVPAISNVTRCPSMPSASRASLGGAWSVSKTTWQRGEARSKEARKTSTASRPRPIAAPKARSRCGAGAAAAAAEPVAWQHAARIARRRVRSLPSPLAGPRLHWLGCWPQGTAAQRCREREAEKRWTSRNVCGAWCWQRSGASTAGRSGDRWQQGHRQGDRPQARGHAGRYHDPRVPEPRARQGRRRGPRCQQPLRRPLPAPGSHRRRQHRGLR
mmetsp:Transcript_80146/g.248741  ORF Transcript_80146/g.248741 Transcript_80146/m.248741 type:complete len:224 (+) Transcript_80146:959-1630(+)